MGFKPLHDRIAVRRVAQDEKTAGGIIIPDTAQEKPSEGTIVAVGNGIRGEDGSITPLDVKKGDHVITPNYTCVSNLSCISQCNGIPVIVEVENDTLGLDYELVKKAIKLYKPKVLQLVHVYGFPGR